MRHPRPRARVAAIGSRPWSCPTTRASGWAAAWTRCRRHAASTTSRSSCSTTPRPTGQRTWWLSSSPRSASSAATRTWASAGGSTWPLPRRPGTSWCWSTPTDICMPGAVDHLMAFALDHPEFVICGGRTVTPDGELDPRSCWAAPSLWSFASSALMLSTLRPGPHGSTRRPWVASGVTRCGRSTSSPAACSWWRSTTGGSLGGFDERYFVYGEDADLCVRATAETGRRCAITPDAVMVHSGGRPRTRTQPSSNFFLRPHHVCAHPVAGLAGAGRPGADRRWGSDPDACGPAGMARGADWSGGLASSTPVVEADSTSP